MSKLCIHSLKMSNLTLSNLTYSNQEYIVLGSNANGVLTIAQPTTAYYYMQISKFVPSTFTNDYTCSITDSTSNITVGLKGSNLQVYNKSSNLFINSIPSSYFLPSLYNTLALNRYDNSLLISINNSNIVRITSSNELPFTFENSKIVVTASNGLKFKDITYQPVGVTNTAMNFTKPVKALTITASNVSACNILDVTASATWSSNNLLNKNTGGAITGNVSITGTIISPTITSLCNLGIFSSNTAVFGSNMSTGVIASSNVAYWSSNNLFNKNNNVILQPNKFLQVGNIYRIDEYNGAGDRWFRLGTLTSNDNGNYIHMYNIDGSRVDDYSFYNYLQFSPRTFAYLPRFNYSRSGNGNTHVNVYANTSNQYEIWVFCQSFTFFKGDINFSGVSINTQPTLNNTWTSSPSEGLTFLYSTASNAPYIQIEQNMGNVGIGTAAPVYKLDVASNARLNNAVVGDAGFGGAWAVFAHSNSHNGTNFGIMNNNAGRTILNCAVGQVINVRTGNTPWGIWNSIGLGVGTEAPTERLTVQGNISVSGNVISPTVTSLSNLAIFGSNTATWGSNTARWSSNLATDTYYKAEWSSNTARWSSNYGATLSNLGTDAWNRGTFSSNNFGQFVGYYDGVYSIWHNKDVSIPLSNYAIKQQANGITWLNGGSNEGVFISESDEPIASFVGGRMSVGNYAPYPLYTLDVQGDARMTDSLTLKRGLEASAGTFTHLPFAGDLKNYIRGTTVICDNGGSVGVGTSTPSALLDVAGLTRTTNFKIGSGGSTIKFLWLGSLTVGTSAGQKKTVTASFPAGSQPSNSNYLVYLDYQSANDDIFVGKIRNKSISSFDLVTYRADGTSWGTSLDCTLMVVGY